MWSNEISSHRHPIVFSIAADRNRRGVFVPFLLIDLLQDYASALLLAQIIYYSGISKNRWFYKSSAEWYDELRMSDDIVRRCLYGDKRTPKRIALVDLGVKVKRKRANGAPTKHYMIDTDEMEAALYNLIRQRQSEGLEIDNPDKSSEPFPEKSRDATGKIQGTITETTTETTTDILAPDEPAPAQPLKLTHQQMMVEAVVTAMGIQKPTKSDYGLAAKISKELRDVGMAPGDVAGLVQFVRNQARNEGWTVPVTMNSLTRNGRVSAFLEARNKSVTTSAEADDVVITMVNYGLDEKENDDEHSG